MTVVTTAQDAPRLKPDSTRERILDAAEKLFADNTYDGTTLREISALVGIREPSLYAHFANKEAIYEAVIDRALLPFSDALLSWNMSELTLNTLFDMPRKLLELHNAHPYCAQILHREFTSPPQRINPKVLQWQQQFVAQSQRFMEGLPASQAISKAKVVANMISCTNLVLGVFSTRGMQSSLMGEDYDQDLMMAEHLRLATRIFKSLLV
ncbi:MAG: helix-turn-helix transcriptional regulator [Ketobacter sp.]|nr:helix-turn-helix transcriptional regulator [Ketobacter sp.]